MVAGNIIAVFCRLFSSACWWSQSHICSSHSWAEGTPADAACTELLRCPESKKLEDLEAKQILGMVSMFPLHANVRKSCFEGEGHWKSCSAEPASVYLVNQHQVLPRNSQLPGISRRSEISGLCWAAAQGEYKSCPSLDWYFCLSWAVQGGCSRSWYGFVGAMTPCPQRFVQQWPVGFPASPGPIAPRQRKKAKRGGKCDYSPMGAQGQPWSMKSVWALLLNYWLQVILFL